MLAGALLVPAAFACNGIVGLDAYDKVACNGTDCDGGSPDVRVDAPADVTTQDVRVDATGTLPVSWAHFKMPNYLQDGGPDANIQTYSPTSGGFLDNVSKLTWLEPIEEPGMKSFEQAQKICAKSTAGGQKWRLPSRIELVTLLDLTRTPAIDPKFPSTEAAPYWTTSEVRGASPPQRWTVKFGDGPGVGRREETAQAGVRCVLAR